MPIEKIIFTEEQAKGGRGTWFLGRFLFWGLNLRRSVIGLGRTQEKINRLGPILAWLVIFAGWLSFGAWLTTQSSVLAAHPLQILFFWRKFDPLIFIFLLSLWFDLFLIYRHCQNLAALKKINYRLFEEKKRPARGSKRYNVAIAYSQSALRAIEDAYLLANKLKQSEVRVIHLFRVLLKAKEVQNLFIRLNVDAKKLVELVDRHLVAPQDKETKGHIDLAPVLQEALVLAFIEA